ncbi:hypothetical protein [Methylobacterium sp. J-076]|uniref:hypothetical protein n=1 Tax=Methylobacterium sp. J-076 TaxID=2836655 RepID=UPI001FB952E9|nr:hypothetical protein [Methylobacterium sp. J-076]MCJ2015192.1 hypothetical protein [Methylobacterium sp. J-076]
MREPVLPIPFRSAIAGLAAACALLTGLAPVPPAFAAEGMAARAPALGMAVTPRDPGMAGGGPPAAPPDAARSEPVPDRPPVQAAPAPRRPRALGSVLPGADGRLPNQRTGPRHEHVVRDICIGC